MGLQAANTGSKSRTIFDTLTRFFGLLLVLVFAYWHSEAFASGRWMALSLVREGYLPITIALRVVKPSQVRRHLVMMGFALALGAKAAASDNQGLMGVSLIQSFFTGFTGCFDSHVVLFQS